MTSPMPVRWGLTLVHALLLEESQSDADKLESCLISSGFGLELRRVASRRDYLDAIDAGGFEIILANHSLPDIDGLTALRIAKDRYPDVPFIFVSERRRRRIRERCP